MTEPRPRIPLPEPVVSIARRGCDEALARLFERHRASLRGYVSARLGARLRSCIEVDDILQEVFLLARRSRSRRELRDEPGFVTWSRRIAENYIRKIARDWAPKRRPRTSTTLSPLAVEVRGLEDAASSALGTGATRVDEELLFQLARGEELRAAEGEL